MVAELPVIIAHYDQLGNQTKTAQSIDFIRFSVKPAFCAGFGV